MRPFLNFQQLSVQLGGLPSTSVHCTCGQDTVHQLISIFHAAWRPSGNYRQLSVWPEDLPSTFRVAWRSSVNFPFVLETFHLFSSILCTAGRPVIFCQLSVRSGDLNSTSVHILCSLETFRQIRSTFRSARRPSRKFHHLSVQLGEVISTSDNISCSRYTFRQLPSTF